MFNKLKNSVLRHIIQNSLMGIPPVREFAQRFHNTGMGRAKERILPVLAKIMSLIKMGDKDLADQMVLELGPGQSPDMLLAALLYGAKQAVGLDINNYLKGDIRRCDNFRELREWIKEAIANEELPLTQAFNANRYDNLIEIPKTDFDIVLYDGYRFPFENESVDIIWTKSVLEHVKNPADTVREMRRCLKPGGIMCHIIDLRDHTAFENGNDWLGFLRHSNALWNMMTWNRSTWTNRLRASQWDSLFSRTGLNCIARDALAEKYHRDFSKKRLTQPFCDLMDEDLSIAWVSFVYKKT